MRCVECQEEVQHHLNWEVIKLDAKERFYILLK